MIFKDDILARITIDFGKDADEALTKPKEAIDKTVDLKTDRLIRCIVFLAKGSLMELNKYSTAAALDPRDVMLWAEYEKSDTGSDPKRVRDFSNTFEKCSIL